MHRSGSVSKSVRGSRQMRIFIGDSDYCLESEIFHLYFTNTHLFVFQEDSTLAGLADRLPENTVSSVFLVILWGDSGKHLEVCISLLIQTMDPFDTVFLSVSQPVIILPYSASQRVLKDMLGLWCNMPQIKCTFRKMTKNMLFKVDV